MGGVFSSDDDEKDLDKSVHHSAYSAHSAHSAPNNRKNKSKHINVNKNKSRKSVHFDANEIYNDQDDITNSCKSINIMNDNVAINDIIDINTINTTDKFDEYNFIESNAAANAKKRKSKKLTSNSSTKKRRYN
jgi:hypothetical protein